MRICWSSVDSLLMLCWQSVDADFHNIVAMLSEAFLPIPWIVKVPWPYGRRPCNHFTTRPKNSHQRQSFLSSLLEYQIKLSVKVNFKLYVMSLCKSYCPTNIWSLSWQPTPCLCTTTHLAPLQVIEFHKTMPFIIETPQLLAFWSGLGKFGWRFDISGWAFLLAKPPSQLLSLFKVYWKLPMTQALAEV